MFYNARYYSPLLSRFVSADTIVPNGDKASLIPLTVDFHEPMFLAGVAGENAFTLQNGFWSQLSGKQKEKAKLPWGPQNLQALNRYAYVLNNPLKHTDPTGHWIKTFSTSSLSYYGTLMATQATAYGRSAKFWGDVYGVSAAVVAGIFGVGGGCVSPAGTLSLGASCVLGVAFTVGAGVVAEQIGYEINGGYLERNLINVVNYINVALELPLNKDRENVEVTFYRLRSGKYYFQISGMAEGIYIDEHAVQEIEKFLGIKSSDSATQE